METPGAGKSCPNATTSSTFSLVTWVPNEVLLWSASVRSHVAVVLWSNVMLTVVFRTFVFSPSGFRFATAPKGMNWKFSSALMSIPKMPRLLSHGSGSKLATATY